MVVKPDGAVIGGSSPEERNVVSGNGADGIHIEFSSTGSSVRGNWVGTDAGGTLAGPITVGSNASINPENTTVTISGNISGGAGAQLLFGVPGTARNGNVTLMRVPCPGALRIVAEELTLLLTGIDLAQTRLRTWWRKSA